VFLSVKVIVCLLVFMRAKSVTPSGLFEVVPMSKWYTHMPLSGWDNCWRYSISAGSSVFTPASIMPSKSLASGFPELSHGRTIAICPLVVTNGVVSTISSALEDLQVHLLSLHILSLPIRSGQQLLYR